MTLTLLVVAGLWPAGPVRAGAPDPLVVDLYFDLAAESLAELDLGADQGATQGAAEAGEIRIAGIPVHLSAAEGDVGWRTVAGANGRYTLALSEAATLVAHGRVTSTDFVEAATADSTVALASGELRYRLDGWALALQPGLEITRWTDGRTHRDSIVEGRASTVLFDGVSLAATARYRWRDATGETVDHREIAFGRLGVVCALPHRARLELALVARQEIADVVATSSGPSVALALPLGEAVDLAANYGYTAMARQARVLVPGVPFEDVHHLGMSLSWDIGGDRSDAALKAGYNFELNDTGSAATPRHTATVKLALSF